MVCPAVLQALYPSQRLKTVTRLYGKTSNLLFLQCWHLPSVQRVLASLSPSGMISGCQRGDYGSCCPPSSRMLKMALARWPLSSATTPGAFNCTPTCRPLPPMNCKCCTLFYPSLLQMLQFPAQTSEFLLYTISH